MKENTPGADDRLYSMSSLSQLSLTIQELQEFTGFYPIPVDSALYSVFEASIEGPSGRAHALFGDQFDEQRFDAIASLHNFFFPALELTSHEVARSVVTTCLSEGKPFCLYLRSFRLGGQVAVIGQSPTGAQDYVNCRVMIEERVEEFLDQTIGDSMPLVGIADPTAGIPYIPMFRVMQPDWQELAGVLARHAAIIVASILALTPGVSAEIDMIRAIGKQPNTLIIWHDHDPFEDEMHASLARVMGASFPPLRGDKADYASMLPDFPHQSILNKEAPDLPGLTPTIDQLLTVPDMVPSLNIPTFPNEPYPPEAVRVKAERLGKLAFGASVTQIANGRMREAMDSAYLSIVFSHWARSRLGQAVGMYQVAKLEAARLEQSGTGRPSIVRDAYQIALKLLHSMKPDPVAVSISVQIIAEYRSFVYAKTGRNLGPDDLRPYE